MSCSSDCLISNDNYFQVIIRNDDTGSVSVFKCNDWLSKTLGDQQLVKELPAITDGEKTLGSKCHDISKIISKHFYVRNPLEQEIP
jgi:hypothetical protein